MKFFDGFRPFDKQVFCLYAGAMFLFLVTLVLKHFDKNLMQLYSCNEHNKHSASVMQIQKSSM